MFLLYAKNFGGKIGKKLHSVPLTTIKLKKFKMAFLKIFPPETCKQSLVQRKKIKNETVISSSTF